MEQLVWCVQLWLDPSIAVDEVPHDPSQIPFPPEMSATELGPAVSDAIMLVLPSVNLCGQSDCNIKSKYCFSPALMVCYSLQFGPSSVRPSFWHAPSLNV